jgi:ATP-binding cassette, subfamily C, bacterial CydC
VLAQAGLLAHALATAARGTGAAALRPTLTILLVVVAARALAAGGGEAVALRAAAKVKAQLRARLTAHLDPASRRALTADILTATQGRATLLITHDLDGLDQVDEIVVLDRGQVVARGTHAELLRAGGLYRRMWLSAHPHG